MAIKRLNPMPPDEIPLDEFLRPLGIGQNRLARDFDLRVARREVWPDAGPRMRKPTAA